MWAAHIVNSGMKQKSEMPAGFYEMLDQRLAIDKELNKSKKQSSEVCAQIFFRTYSININGINAIMFQVPESDLKMSLNMNGVTIRMFMHNVLMLATLQTELRNHYGLFIFHH